MRRVLSTASNTRWAAEVQNIFVEIWEDHKLKFAGQLANAFPVVGHFEGQDATLVSNVFKLIQSYAPLQGGVQLAMGDNEGGWRVVKSVERSAFVHIAGAAGSFAGPRGAFATRAAVGAFGGVADGTCLRQLKHIVNVLHCLPLQVIEGNPQDAWSSASSMGHLGIVFDTIVLVLEDGISRGPRLVVRKAFCVLGTTTSVNI